MVNFIVSYASSIGVTGVNSRVELADKESKLSCMYNGTDVCIIWKSTAIQGFDCGRVEEQRPII